jgi:hypothetical protein
VAAGCCRQHCKNDGQDIEDCHGKIPPLSVVLRRLDCHHPALEDKKRASRPASLVEKMGNLDESCISKPKPEVSHWTGRQAVQSDTSGFGFEMQDSSNFPFFRTRGCFKYVVSLTQTPKIQPSRRTRDDRISSGAQRFGFLEKARSPAAEINASVSWSVGRGPGRVPAVRHPSCYQRIV